MIKVTFILGLTVLLVLQGIPDSASACGKCARTKPRGLICGKNAVFMYERQCLNDCTRDRGTDWFDEACAMDPKELGCICKEDYRMVNGECRPKHECPKIDPDELVDPPQKG